MKRLVFLAFALIALTGASAQGQIGQILPSAKITLAPSAHVDIYIKPSGAVGAYITFNCDRGDVTATDSTTGRILATGHSVEFKNPEGPGSLYAACRAPDTSRAGSRINL
jgi:hypothetical protein